ncbi:MAG: sporulation integral membrane protein YlbJ [Clostridiaceae bacterium]
MIYYIIVLFAFYFILKSKYNREVKKSLIYTFIFSIFLICIVINPKNTLEYILSGSYLFFLKVFPSVFPFVIISNIIIYFNGIKIYSKLLGKVLCKPIGLPLNCSLVVIISFLCGYPLGAKYASYLYNNGEIEFYTFKKLVNVASNPSLFFVVGAIGFSMLGDVKLGYILILSCYLSCIAMGFIIKSPKLEKNLSFKSEWNKNQDLGSALKEGVNNGLTTSFIIFSFVVLFSLITGMIANSNLFAIIINYLYKFFKIPKEISSSLMLGMIEVTNGCNSLSLTKLNIVTKTIISSFLLSFGGLSITSQVYSFIGEYKIPLNYYFKNKFTQGIISSLITAILLIIS